MAGNIAKMSPEAVQAAISNFSTREHEFMDVVNAIKGVMFDLEGTWTGVAEQTYENQVRALLKNLETIQQSMEGAKGKLQLAINAYQETEGKNVSAISGVDSTPAAYDFEG